MTFSLALIGTLLLLAGIGYFGWRKPAYSHWQDTISELGEVGSPLSRLVSYGLFFPVGLLLGLVAILADSPPVAGLAGCVGVGYIVAAFFPCDVGSPLSGSVRQQIHNAGEPPSMWAVLIGLLESVLNGSCLIIICML